MNVVQLLLLAALGEYAVVKSDNNGRKPISPGDFLQEFLCNKSLQLNATLVLDAGEHRINFGPLGCSISNMSYVKILGSHSGESVILCQRDSMPIGFVGVRNLTIEKVNFVGCNVFSKFVQYVSIRHCTFQGDSPGYSVTSESSGHIDISDCTFQQNNGVLSIKGSTGTTTISNCVFQKNYYSFLVVIFETKENIHIRNCKFDNNIAQLISIQSSGRIEISDSTFQNNTASYDTTMETRGERIRISNCTFDNNSAGVVVRFTITTSNGNNYDGLKVNDSFQEDGSTASISITKCTFQSNLFWWILLDIWDSFNNGGDTYISDSIMEGNFIDNRSDFSADGTGEKYSLILDVNKLSGSVHIANTTFKKTGTHIKAGYGQGTVAVFILHTPDKFSLSNCTFMDVVLGVFTVTDDKQMKASTTTQISITDSTFQNGTTESVPSLFLILWNPRCIVNIARCTFQMNNGGALAIYEFLPVSLDVTITECAFFNNSAIYGGAILIVSKGQFLIVNSTFVNNSARVGAAVMVGNEAAGTNGVAVIELCRLTLVDVVVKNNYCNAGNYDETRGGAISFYGATVDIGGSAHRGSHFILNGPQGAIQGVDGYLQFRGNVIFVNNSGENGGAISLLNVRLSFLDEGIFSFIGNTASRFGGAIYIEGQRRISFHFAYGHVQSWKFCAILNNKSTITFQNNYALLAGHAIHATPLYGCYFENSFRFRNYNDQLQVNLDVYHKIFNVSMAYQSSQIVSSPVNVTICQSNDQNLFNYSTQLGLGVYPGGTLQLNVTTMDSGRVLSPSAVYAQVKVIGTRSIRLGAQQDVQWVGKECTTLLYQIYGPEMTSLNLLLSSYPGNAPKVVKVYLLPCVAGFELSSDTCVCSSFLTSVGVACDADQSTVSRDGNQWIGVYKNENKSGPAVASVCPLNYCKDVSQISLAHSEALCSGGRTGILCGRCSNGSSVVFGSSECQVCSNMWLNSIILYAILGILLVVVLFVLNITVAEGTLYGLLFYANIIQVNATIFFSQSVLGPLQVMISFLNLDFGFPQCFYDGMDDTAKTGLQFVFPVYLLTLTITVTVFFHYCLHRNTEHKRCFDGISYIVGQRAVGVLSTLVYLSYSKLLRTVIDIFSFSTVQYDGGFVRVWFYDGNIKYLHDKHAALFVVAIGICILFLLPYTLALTFIPVIEHYSEHNRFFNYLHKVANRVKPMNDVYFASFRGQYRFWLGARLWLLMFLYIVSSVFSSDQPKLLLLIHTVTVMTVVLIQSRINPFGMFSAHNRIESVLNEFYNCFDLFYLFNYSTLSLLVIYIVDQKEHRTQMDIIVGIFVGLYGVLVVVTILYHVIVTILMVCNVHERAKEKIRSFILPTQTQSKPTELYVLSHSDLDNVETSCDLREPLSETSEVI